MKQVFHKITAVTMAVVVLMSTLSYTVFEHYCGTTLVDIGYFTQADGCGMETSSDMTPSDCDIAKKDCCSDNTLTIEGQKDLKLGQEIQLVKQFFVAPTFVSFLSESIQSNSNPPLYRDYHPPPLVRPIFKLDEQYLI